MPTGLTIFQRRPTEIVGVRMGFSWPAFFFGSLWALVKRAWWLVALLALVEIVIWFGGGYAVQTHRVLLALLVAVANLGFALVRGVYGNRWLQASLKARGFVQVSRPG